jgi:excinuclease UvrABC ATPase subunit
MLCIFENSLLKSISCDSCILKFMNDVGIEYLQLNRQAHTLSGGEAQRIRLASQLGSGLVGALYVLDEPTIGLHSRDNDRLIKTLLDLRDLARSLVSYSAKLSFLRLFHIFNKIYSLLMAFFR